VLDAESADPRQAGVTRPGGRQVVDLPVAIVVEAVADLRLGHAAGLAATTTSPTAIAGAHADRRLAAGSHR